jgi:adenosylcobinamide-phosphate synthase
MAGFVADAMLGDPARWHPVAGFGRVAERLEARLYSPSRVRGTVFVALLVAGAVALAELAARRTGRAFASALLLWVTLGGRSLRREALRVAAMLDAGGLQQARRMLPALVGRDTARLDQSEVCRAVVESVAENTADAVLGPLVWSAVAGPRGAVAYRAVNTLDAMVGHRSARYERFGWAAARLDDAMSWPAARLGACLAVAAAPVVGGSPRETAAVLARDGGAHPSPNAGRMEAAFAGALGLQLGGRLDYDGRAELRPTLGSGHAPTTDDIRRAARISGIVAAAAALLCALIGRRS